MDEVPTERPVEIAPCLEDNDRSTPPPAIELNAAAADIHQFA
jgi:hypothetical protein